MAMGRGEAGPKDGVFALVPEDFVLLHPRPVPHDMENLLPHLRLLGPCEVLSHFVKLDFLLICLTISTHFFNKTYFINKNIFEITTKFIQSNQIKSIFIKNLIIYLIV